MTLRGLPMCGLTCLLLVAGCHSVPLAHLVDSAREDYGLQVVAFEQPAPEPKQDFLPPVQAKPKTHPEVRPEPEPIKVPLPPLAENRGKPIPISLDTVLRLAQDQNGQVRLARMKVEDAVTDHHWAQKHWLPDLSLGIGAYRHDGGIVDFNGNLLNTNYTTAMPGVEIAGKYDWKELLIRRVESERRVWQQKAELSKLNSENLLDAASTYVGLLAARSGVAISMETELRLKDLLDQTKKLATVDPGVGVEVSRIEAELMAQTVLTVRLREAGKASSAKLAYLLGLNPCCEFIVADGKLVPINLVNTKLPTSKLVDHAISVGPGVRELEGLLRTVEVARNANYGWSHWMPAVDVGFLASGIGSGQDTALNWSGRSDVYVKAKWNLSEFWYAKAKRHQADMNIQQVHLSIQDLRSKLTLGVQEARDAISSGYEQMILADRHIKHAEESYRLSDQRLRENIKGRSASEVLLALRTLGGARLEYIQAVRDLNRAQLRLFVLVGSAEN